MGAVNPIESVRFGVHFDGPITTEHMLTVRSMARTYSSIQSTLDRAFLAEKHGAVWKHARLTKDDYEKTEFLAAYPREGGIILDAIRASSAMSRRTVDRVYSAAIGPFERALRGGINEAQHMADQVANVRYNARRMELNAENTPTLQAIMDNPPADWQLAYTDRSINKEIDQLISPITAEALEGSIVEINLVGGRQHPQLQFTAETARNFHKIVAARTLGPVAVINGRIRELDRGNKFSKPKARILNLDTNRESTLHLFSDGDFHDLHPFHTAEVVQLLVAPFLEAGGFDAHGGDLLFVAVAA